METRQGMRVLEWWEILLIRACKMNTVSMVRLKKIHARFCGMDACHIPDRFVVDKLVTLVDELGLVQGRLHEFVTLMQPESCWRAANLVKFDGSDRDGLLIAASAAVLGNAPVKDLPGYVGRSRIARAV